MKFDRTQINVMNDPKKISRGISALVLFLALATGCHETPSGEIRTTVKGSFPAFAGRKLTLSEIDLYKAIPLDTAEIGRNGSFSFKFRRDSAGFYLLKIDNRNYITLVLDKEKKVIVKSAAENIKSDYTVEGSEYSGKLQVFEAFIEANSRKVDSITIAYNNSIGSTHFIEITPGLNKAYDDIFENQRKFAMAFIENNCNSLASLLVLNRRFGKRRVLTEEGDARYFLLLDSCLSERYPGNKHIKELNARVQRIRERERIAPRPVENPY